MKYSVCVSLLGLLATVAGAKMPESCKRLSGINAFEIKGADGRKTIRYTYADEAQRIPHLQCRVDQDDRAAMVELGRAYETGEQVERDEARAVTLFEKSAQDRPAYSSIYAPPVTLGGAGQVMMMPIPGGGPGSPEAKYRLGRMLIEGRGIAQDPVRGQSLVDAAVKQGWSDIEKATPQ